jgi:CheY-like chemotaxis protein
MTGSDTSDGIVIHNYFGYGSHHALLVDDDPASARAMLTLLNEFMIDVTIAIDGRQALRLLKENDYDMFILDWSMPDLDGKWVIEAAFHQLSQMGAAKRARTLKMPIVIHTGLVAGEVKLPPEAKNFKCVELLPKPAGLKEVKKIVTKVLG